MFLKNCWYVAAFAEELSSKPIARTLLNEPVVLFRQANGLPAALEDRCCHRGLPLAHGKLVPEGIQCGYHGLVFNAQGLCVRVPGQDTVPRAACVASYPVVERDALVWIWLVAASYGLLVDNLLDLTHVGYVHGSTIGGQPDAHSNAEMKTSRTDNSVSVVRWLRNSLPPPTYVLAADFKGRVDRWIEIGFKPGLITINAGAKDAGTGAYEGNREGGFSLRSLHAVTPETESTTHYFWTIAHRVRAGMPELTERVYLEIVAAFAEDKIIIESQFARLQQRPLPPLIDIKSDAPAIQARRIIAIRMERERRVVSEASANKMATVEN